ncbi:uncharacterized protein LOC112086236 [Eutrema salsugineum]|uniref:uncharacterized protein LOC112086236 n=1 Tax=Eutrema salsugineum TaxID=72664 RepID=UPI000CED1A71|nr:uncharacterized protein LOC112086236 [Eutrema salsugineum]
MEKTLIEPIGVRVQAGIKANPQDQVYPSSQAPQNFVPNNNFQGSFQPKNQFVQNQGYSQHQQQPVQGSSFSSQQQPKAPPGFGQTQFQHQFQSAPVNQQHQMGPDMVGILQQLLQGQQMFASQYASMQQHIMELKQNQASTSRSQGGLPGKPEPNPKEYAKAITLRSDKELPGIEHNNVIIEDNDQISGEAAPRDDQEAERSKKGKEKEVEKPSEPEKPYVPPPPYQPKLLYPRRFKKQIVDKANALFEKTLNETPLTMPLIEAFLMMPKLGKFLKEVILNKTKELQGMVVLSHECSAIIQRKSIPRKLTDPGSFTLSCAIGPLMFAGCLCDLGASVSLMLFSARKLGYRTFKPAKISLVLADRSVRLPIGMLEDLPVKIGGFEVPTDFMVLEMVEEPVDPLILGKPFLATAGGIIDVRKGIIELQLGSERLKFDVNEMMKKPTIEGQVFYVETMDELADELLEELNTEDYLQIALTKEHGDHGYLED